MNLDIPTLAFISCLTFLSQLLALLVQYRVVRTYRGVGWWLLGAGVSTVGVICLPLVSVPGWVVLAMIANPLIVIGQLCLYVGLARFLNKPEQKWALVSLLAVFLLAYYYFIFGQNSLSARTFVLDATLAALSFMSAAVLFFNRDRRLAGSVKFTAAVFFAYGCFLSWRAVWVLAAAPLQAYADPALLLALSFVVPIVASLLWTLGFIIMINQRLNGEYRQETENLQLVFNTSPDAAMISRLADGAIVDVNAGFVTMSGYSRAELIGNTTLQINIWHRPDDRESFLKALQARGYCEGLEAVFQAKDGRTAVGSVSARVIAIRAVPHVVSVVHDITKSKQAQEALRESEALYRSILNASPDDITITDLQGNILVTSPAAAKMFGYDPERDPIVGSQVVDYLVPEDRDRARANLIRMFRGNYEGPNEYHAVRNDQTTFDIEVNSAVIKDGAGQPAKVVFVIRNITERKQADQRIQQLVQQLEEEKKTAQLNAITDSLTGLANRRYFDEVLSAEFQRMQRPGTPLSLIMLDVDQFKKFNDTYGHLAGDACLTQIGAMLKALVRRAADMSARYGGEEFVTILPGTDQAGAVELAERIRQAVEMLDIPHSGSEVARHVTVSLGVATAFPCQLESAVQLLAQADEALYRSKQDGRNRTSLRPAAQSTIGQARQALPLITSTAGALKPSDVP